MSDDKTILKHAYRDRYDSAFQPDVSMGDRPISAGRGEDALEYLAAHIGRISHSLERIAKVLERHEAIGRRQSRNR